jgi:signal transduction histidine kinase
MSSQDNWREAPDTIEAGSDGPRLLDVLVQVGLHDHICLIYESQEEQLAMPVPSIRMGLERGEKCIFVAPEKTASDVNEALHAIGIDVDDAVKSGRLAVASQEDTYLRNSHFEPDRMIRFWADALEPAIASGFSGLRVVSDMSWALGGDPGTGPLIEYEAKLNYFVRNHPIAVTCQYDRNRFSPEVILNMIRTHPIVIYGNFVCSNPYYVPPEEFLAPNHAEMEVKRLLANIRDREQANKAMRELSRRLFQMQDEEHRRIGRELHDSIAQELAAVSMNLGELQRRIEGRDLITDNLLSDSMALVEQCNREIRTISHLLHPPLLDELGLRRALQDYIEGFAGRSAIVTTVDVAEDLDRLPAEIETALFRVVQESLGNIHRHSGSTTAAIRIRRDAGTVRLEISDEGGGLPPGLRQGNKELSVPVGVGIAGMRERLGQAGGELEIESSDRGTTVRAIVPLPRDAS